MSRKPATPRTCQVSTSNGMQRAARYSKAGAPLAITRLGPLAHYAVTHTASGWACLPGINSLAEARIALAEFLALPVDWTLPRPQLLEAAAPHKETIRLIRQRARAIY